MNALYHCDYNHIREKEKCSIMYTVRVKSYIFIFMSGCIYQGDFNHNQERKVNSCMYDIRIRVCAYIHEYTIDVFVSM
jgi:hypothetical protein